MADIKIKRTKNIPLNSEETTIEVTGVEHGADMFYEITGIEVKGI